MNSFRPNRDQSSSQAGSPSRPGARWIGLLLGPALALLCLVLPLRLGFEARAVLATVVLMATWWITEALPLGATSLIPLVAFPALGVLSPKDAAAPYADPTVFLFLGGFMLAQAFQKWGLDRRLALHVLLRVGTEPRRLLLGFMVFTAAVSMWVSNTATTLILLPLGIGVLSQLQRSDQPSLRHDGKSFRTVLMLGIAYAASIGGMATLIGTPPNLIFAGIASRTLTQGPEVSFARWMIVGFPFALAFLGIAWAYLAFVRLRPRETPSASEIRVQFEEEVSAIGPISWAEKTVMIVFFLTVAAWIFRADLDLGFVRVPGWSTSLGLDVHDGTIAIAAALSLFLLPARNETNEPVLDWETAVRVPWNIVFLFGGGFALAEGFRASGLDSWLGSGLGNLAGLPVPLIILLVCLGMTFASEIASNTALAAIALPILAAGAPTLGMHPLWLMVPATLAVASGFMLPIATPPNAIVFASGQVRIQDMVRAGIVLDLLGALLITVSVWVLLPLAFDVPRP